MKKLTTLLSLFSLAAVASAQVTFTVLGGTNLNASNGEGCESAFDGNLSTKWGMFSGDAWVSLDAGEVITLTGYTFTTANDNKLYNGRLPIEWEIYGTNDETAAKNMTAASELKASGTAWELVYDVLGKNEVQQMQIEDYTAHYFAQPYGTKAYRYYAFKNVISGSQLSEIQFSYTKNKHLDYTFVSGSNGFDGEGPANVFDGLGSTKICSNTGTSDRYLIFKTSQPTKVGGYTFITGNDASDRDPKSWTLYGMTSDSDPERNAEGWVQIDSKTGQTMTAARMAHQHYTVSSPSDTEYNYFKLEVGETSSSMWQFQEFFLTTESEDQGRMFCYRYNGGYSGEEAWHLLDGNYDTKLCGSIGSGVIFGNGSQVSLTGYMLKVANENGNYNRYPSQVTFYGSNADDCPKWDGTWEKIETVTENASDYNYTYTEDDKEKTGWYLVYQACRYYHFSQPTAQYKYFKFVVDATMGAGITQIGILQPFFARGDKQQALELREDTKPMFNGVVTVEDAKIKRTITADKWIGLCLPFDYDIPSGWDVRELTDVNGSGESASMVFSAATSIEAGKPYLVKTTSNVAEISVTNKTFGTPAKSVEEGGVSMIGNLAQTTIPEGSFYINTSSQLKKLTGNTATLKGFRAYFTVDGASGVKALSFDFDDDATGLDDLKDLRDSNDLIYNLAGQRPGKMQKGINIINGKKILK